MLLDSFNVSGSKGLGKRKGMVCVVCVCVCWGIKEGLGHVREVLQNP